MGIYDQDYRKRPENFFWRNTKFNLSIVAVMVLVVSIITFFTDREKFWELWGWLIE